MRRWITLPRNVPIPARGVWIILPRPPNNRSNSSLGQLGDEPVFQTNCPHPPGLRITADQFSSALNSNIALMHREAATAVVTLAQPAEAFSFVQQRQALSYAPGSLLPLARQVGEVKAICEVLFRAGINSLENVRRERVSIDDDKGPATDYLETNSITNAIVVLTPYEVTFTCSSTELAAVMAGFANSPNVLVVKAVDVEPVLQLELGDPSTNGPPKRGKGLMTVIDEKRLQVTMLINVVKLR